VAQAVGSTRSATVPARALQELARIAQSAAADELSVSVHTNQIVFEIGGRDEDAGEDRPRPRPGRDARRARDGAGRPRRLASVRPCEHRAEREAQHATPDPEDRQCDEDEEEHVTPVIGGLRCD
jgi:hypothetical protein